MMTLRIQRLPHAEGAVFMFPSPFLTFLEMSIDPFLS